MVVDLSQMPHSVEAEIAVIGGIILDNLSIHSIGSLSTEDFYVAKNRVIFSAIMALSMQGDAIDHVTLGELLRKRGDIESVGGAIGLSKITDSVATSANVSHYAKIVKSKSNVRRMITTCRQILASGLSDPEDADEYISTAMSSVASMSGDLTGDDEHVGHDVNGLLTSIISPVNTRYQKTGIYKIDSSIGGMPCSKAFIVAARPGTGKSTLALSIAHNVSKERPVLYFTLEDTSESQRIRIISRLSGVPYNQIEIGGMAGEQLRDITFAASKLPSLQLWFRDRRLTVAQITRCAIGWSMKHKAPGLIVIDHLGYINTPGQGSGYEKVSDNMRELAYLAKEVACPVMVVCQLNRQVENDIRKNDNGVDVPRWPRVSDLRDSGKIEEDARAIWMLHRGGMYDPDSPQNEIYVLIRKNTGGPKPNLLLDNCNIACCNIE